MASIQSSVGLISGMPIQDLVDTIITASSKPRDLLLERNKTLQAQHAAVTELSALLLKVQYVAKNLAKSDLYDRRKATSSAAATLSTTVTGQPPKGTYQFTPIRMVQSQQRLSSSFQSATAALGKGELSFRYGPSVQRGTPLEFLDGGHGLLRGKIRITDRSGASAEIDLTTTQTLDDVIAAINDNSTIQVTAIAHGDQIRLVDDTGQTASNLRVQEVGSGSTAASLGLDGINVADNVADGRDLLRLYQGISLTALNDGNGVVADRVLPDIQFQLRDGSTGTIDLSPIQQGSSAVVEERTLGDVLQAINAAAPGKLLAEIAPDGKRLQVTDLTQGSNAFQLTSLNDSAALQNLGLDAPADNGVVTGRRLMGGLNSVLLSSLGGGRGLGSLGQLQIIDRSGASAIVDVSQAETLQDVIDAINGAGIGIAAQTNRAGNGIELRDITGASSGHMIVRDPTELVAGDIDGDLDVDTSDVQAILSGGKYNTGQPAGWSQGDFNADGLVDSQDVQLMLQTGAFKAGSYAKESTASALGIAVDADVTSVNSGDLHLQVVAYNTRLDSLNGGAGIARGSFDVLDSAGHRATINLQSQSIQTIGDVVRELNRSNAQIQAEINSTGDGILIRDTANGSGKLQITEGSSTTAAGLHLLRDMAEVNIDGNTSQVIDGSTTYTVKLDGKMSLNDLRQKINDLNAGVTASTFVDGSSMPYRLALVSNRAGKAGEMLVDTSAVDFTLEETVAAQDALLAFGHGSTTASTLVSSASNTFLGVLDGVSLEIKQTSTSPVTVTVSASDTDMVASAKTMVENYNAFRKRLGELTKFDVETQIGSVLTGDASALRLDSDVSYLLSGRFATSGSIRTLADVGITLEKDGTLTLDETKLKAAYASDPAAVDSFFTAQENGFAVRLDKLIEQLCGDRISLLTRRSQALEDKVTQNSDRVKRMNTRLDAQRERLMLQFYRMEVAIGKMQSSLTAISAIQPLASTTTSSKS